MVWNLIIPAAAALIGGRQSAKAVQSAAETSANAADKSSEIQRETNERNIALQREINDRNIALQREMFERNVQLQEPFRQSGINALAKLEPLASNYTPFGMDQFQADPGYGFRMSEGMKGLERSAAARGGLLSGAALKGIQRFGQDLASQEYQNAFNRYQTERSARLNPLQSLAGVGQTAANTLGTAGTQFANTVGQGNTGFANTVGQSNAQLANTLSNIGMNQAAVAGNAGMARASIYGDTLNQLANIGGRYFGGSGGGSPSNRDIERTYLGMR
jgi:hypothetical protein